MAACEVFGYAIATQSKYDEAKTELCENNENHNKCGWLKGEYRQNCDNNNCGEIDEWYSWC